MFSIIFCLLINKYCYVVLFLFYTIENEKMKKKILICWIIWFLKFFISFFLLLLLLLNFKESKRKDHQIWIRALLLAFFLFLFAPFILFAHLLLFGRREVILDVKRFSNLLGRFALDHVGHRFACDVEQTLNVQVVGGQYELEQCSLVDFEELHVPCGDVVSHFLPVLLVFGRRRVVLVVRAPCDHFFKDCGVHVGQRNRLLVVVAHSELFQHCSNRVRLFGYLCLDLKYFAIWALQF